MNRDPRVEITQVFRCFSCNYCFVLQTDFRNHLNQTQCGARYPEIIRQIIQQSENGNSSLIHCFDFVPSSQNITQVPNSTREIVRRQIQSGSQFQHQKEENESQLVTQDRSHEHEIKLSPTETELQKSTNHCDTEIPQQRSIPAKRKHVCPECNKCFNQTSNFKMHMQIHYGIKQFKCLECGKLFRQKAHLLKHVEVHNRYKRATNNNLIY